jgi:hypothetical protein
MRDSGKRAVPLSYKQELVHDWSRECFNIEADDTNDLIIIIMWRDLVSAACV